MIGKRYLMAGLLLVGSGAAQGACDFRIEVGDTMLYGLDEMVVEKGCETIGVTLEHTGDLPKIAMGHNWVLAKTGDVAAIATDGMAAGLDNDYLKPGDARVIAATEVIGAGETTSIRFSPADLKAGEDYTFFCSFPGHYTVMKGRFIVE
ncbi:azurin [Thiococcus pfennigii]|uniref:azurin n=1 Tax=Thiococcus pfennigii TaxID=1057 RepID=UPI0019054962|nr:azurin [Thiococcus pfennigii]